jgi:hypothetical protein
VLARRRDGLMRGREFRLRNPITRSAEGSS